MMLVKACDPLELRSMYQRDEGSLDPKINNLKFVFHLNVYTSAQIRKIVMEKEAWEMWAEW